MGRGHQPRLSHEDHQSGQLHDRNQPTYSHRRREAEERGRGQTSYEELLEGVINNG